MYTKGQVSADFVSRVLDRGPSMIMARKMATASAVASLAVSISTVAWTVFMVLRHPVRPGDHSEAMARALSVGGLSFFAVFFFALSIQFLRKRRWISRDLREELAREIMET